MIGTHQSQFKFQCPFCFAGVGKPCVHPSGPRKGKTTKCHPARKVKAARATNAQKDPVIFTNAVETNPRRH